jgi:hypothetical protein
MSLSRLQDIFLRELVATNQRIARRLADLAPADSAARDAVLREELQGLYHGVLVIFDGGTALADHGLVSIVDDRGASFDRWLHEICLKYWPTEETV